jgi:hypothetical protein
MPEYEKNCLKEYTYDGEDKKIFSNEGDLKFAEHLSGIKNADSENSFEHLNLLLKNEIAEVKAF